MSLVRALSFVVCGLFLLASPPAAQAGSAATDAETFDAHAAGAATIFSDGDMEFHFVNLALGAAVNGGMEIGEAFVVASGIPDGNAAAWQAQWAAMAGRVAARGEVALAAGHGVSAREQFVRAANYLRLSLISMPSDHPEFVSRATRSRELMRRAGALCEPPLEYFEVPFEGRVLPGYFQAAPGPGPHKTLLMIGGGETFAEDLYFYIAPKAIERGYNFVTVDLPGQGLLPAQGLFFRTDMGQTLRPVVDAVLRRPEVDPNRLAAYGISGGGLFVPQAAQRDPRLKAIVMNAAVVDAKALFATMPSLKATATEMGTWSSFHAGVVRAICWRFGVPENDPAALIAVNEGNTFDPAAIAVPALIVVGQGEYRSREVQRQQLAALDGFPNPAKRLVVTPADEGAAGHCVMENRSLMSQVVFDWLDEIFAAR